MVLYSQAAKSFFRQQPNLLLADPHLMVSHDLNTTLLDELGRIFDWQPDPALYFPTAATEKLRQQLGDALAEGNAVSVLTGATGAGKTLLLQLSLQDLSGRWAHVAQLSYTSMSGAEILRSAAYAFGMPAGHGDTPTPAAWTENRLRYWARQGEASLLVVDEAQNLPLDALAPLLALSKPQETGGPLLQLILVGRPAALDLVHHHIKPALAMPAFQPHESAAYIADRLRQIAAPGLPVLSAAVIAEIHARTHGRPGRINLLCKQLLQNAVLLEEDATIDTAAVKAGADELGFGAADISQPAPLSVEPMPAPAALAVVAPVHSSKDRPIDRPVVPPAPLPGHRKSRVMPAVALLLLAAIGTGLFLMQPAAPTPAATAAVVQPPPAPPPPKLEVTPEPAPTVVQTQSEPPQNPPALVHTAEPVQIAQPIRTAPRQATPAGKPEKSAQPAKPAKPEAPEKPLVVLAPPTRPAPVTPSRSANALCAHLLAQLSLGEPLSAGQQHTLESTCR